MTTPYKNRSSIVFSHISRNLKKLLKNEDGQAITEYVILLSLVITLAVSLMRAINGAIDRGLLMFGSKLERMLKTGRIPSDVWEN